jgi:WD40 repeat protein
VELTTIAIHPDGHFLTLGSSDGVIRIWGIMPQKELSQLEGQTVRKKSNYLMLRNELHIFPSPKTASTWLQLGKAK